MRAGLLTFWVLALTAIAGATAHAAVPAVQSHRGGAVRDGVPAYAEGSMAAFRSAWSKEKTALELDVKLSADRVPVVMHDDTLDRTTICTGRIDSLTWAQLRSDCPSDVLGMDGFITAPAHPLVPIASLREVLDYARSKGATLNIEIKNIPGEADFDPTPGFATRILEEIKASRIPLRQVIIQSFWPFNLDLAKQILPGAQTAFLTGSGSTNTLGPAYAALRGYTWWSPGWPFSKSEVDLAHALGLKVVPWTLNNPAAVKSAAEMGVEALITDDPVMAKRALGLAR
jgi:glycerophosphoryl diester phosphodiesterase